MVERIKPGDELLVRNIFDQWVEATAVTGVEGTHRNGEKIHDFPVVWIDIAGAGASMPWPLEAVRRKEGTDG